MINFTNILILLLITRNIFILYKYILIFIGIFSYDFKYEQ